MYLLISGHKVGENVDSVSLLFLANLDSHLFRQKQTENKSSPFLSQIEFMLRDHLSFSSPTAIPIRHFHLLRIRRYLRR